jgi:hypothetical protein
MLRPAVLVLDISAPGQWTEDHDDRRVLQALDDLPGGTRVVVTVGSRWYVTAAAVQIVHRNLRRLDVQVEGRDYRVLQRWHECFRTGTLEPAGVVL